MPAGGKRPGAGRKKGPQTLEKEALRALVREKVGKALSRLIDSQIANAEGIKYLVVRDKRTGKFLRATKNAAEKLDPEQEIIEVWEKDPSVQAFTDLLNRTIDKPAEHVELTGQDGAPIVIKWLS